MLRKIMKGVLLIRYYLVYNPKHHAWHDYTYKFIKTKNNIEHLLNVQLKDARILIYGCGYHYPELALFDAVANQAQGIDMLRAFYRDGLRITASDILLSLGIPSLFGPAAAWFKKNYFYRRYYYQLRKLSGVQFHHNNYSITSYDGNHLPYEDNTFDLVLSNSVLEHVSDLDNGFEEIRRVLKPGGLSYHLWHNFYCFTGGHAPNELTHKYPWGHILGQYPTPYLNRLTPDEIKKLSKKYLELISISGVDRQYHQQVTDAEFLYEEEDLLTDKLLQELPKLPREWFLTTAYCIAGRKK